MVADSCYAWVKCILDDIIAINPVLLDHEDPTEVASTNVEEEEKVIEEAVQNDDNDQIVNTETTTDCCGLIQKIRKMFSRVASFCV